MALWQTTHTIESDPPQVLAALTDPNTIRRWSPIEFDLAELDGRRLETGAHARVAGRIAGREVAFDIEVLAADEAGLWLRASGPIEIEVEYVLVPLGGRTEVDASVSVAGRGGLLGRLLSSATDGLLAAGALDRAVGRIADEIETCPVALAA
jgi:uncharacterized protein YndB with AHSA1/START domain